MPHPKGISMHMRTVPIMFKWSGWSNFLLLLCLFLVLQGTSCVSDLPVQGQEPEPELPEPDPIDTTDIPIQRVAIALYNPVGVRQEPGQREYTSDGEKNYITPITYGEQVEMIDTPYVEIDDREYMKIRLGDGTEGWVWAFLMEPYGRRAVMTDEAELYRRPDFMTLRNDKFLKAQIIVVIEDPENPGSYGDWLHVSSFEKEKKGWIRRKNNLTFEQKEVETALFFYRARILKSPEERRQALGELLSRDSTQTSVFRPLIEEEFRLTADEVDPEVLANENFSFDVEEKLFIAQPDVNMYENPDVTSAVVSALSQNDVCVVLSKGEQATVNDVEDYWYRVRFEEKVGWVFGYYTSVRDL